MSEQIPAAPRPSSSLQADWLALFNAASPATRAALHDAVCRYGPRLADAFYASMMADAEAHVFLSHDVVERRLRQSMQRWLETLFSCADEAQFAAAMALQRHVGEVHARIEVPVNTVARGARLLKGRLAHCLHEDGLEGEALVEAVLYAYNLIDLAFEEMSAAYVTWHERAVRVDEAYRVFSHGHNMSLERERQRSALLDWENRFLQDMVTGAEGQALQGLAGSGLGLWLQHKATAIFEGATELPSIQAAIRVIDGELLPRCETQRSGRNRGEVRRLICAVESELTQLKFLLGTMFERFVDLESGKDALTQLLNRRFLPAILGREIELCRRSAGKPFALLLVDADHFKRINDEHGHEAGDRVLQQVANLLLNAVRAGDFVFRYGGEEFLVLLVEVDEAHCRRVAEKIRGRVEAESFSLADGRSLQVTASIGVAVYDGHPDYQRLVRRADEALYRAKREGRNRVVLADG